MKKIFFLIFYFHFVKLKLFLNFQLIKKNIFMNKINVNNIYINNLKINFEIKFNDYKIYISNYLMKKENNNENEIYFKELNDFDGFKTKNNFNINNKIINDVNVIAIQDDENNYFNNNIIGFEYRRNQENFLKQLYNKKIIENEIIFVDFYQNKIFFDYPNNISNIKYIKAIIDGFLINFSINLDKIYTNVIKDSKLILNNNYSDFLENKYFEIEFNFNLNGIVAPFEFENYLKNNLNILNYCEKISYIENNLYYYYKCNESKLLNNFKNININFYNKFINFTFNLNLKDLTEKEINNNNFIIKILFNEYYNNWILGKIFLEKYPFVFDYSKKLLGVIIKSENNNNNNKKKFFYFFSYFILIIIILILIRYLKIIKTRKKRTNEIIDGFYYNFSLNINNNNINKKSNKIIN